MNEPLSPYALLLLLAGLAAGVVAYTYPQAGVAILVGVGVVSVLSLLTKP
ncbi:hypothetical protein [Streptomyces triticiradicis]|nr:hypothetical protein [Streptomyces triticiradicis]